MFAAFRLGAVWVPTNFRLLPGEIVCLARTSGSALFLCHADFPDHAAAVREAMPDIAVVRLGGQGTFGDADIGPLIEEHRGVQVPAAAVEHDDPCWFFFTSGTTGRSKAAVLTQGQMAFVVNNHLCDLVPGTTEEDASLVVAPLSHGAGIHQLNVVARGHRRSCCRPTASTWTRPSA